MAKAAKNRKRETGEAKRAAADVPARVSTATAVEPAERLPENLPLLPPKVEQWLRKQAAAIGIALFLVAATLAVYGQTIGFDFVSYDDDQYVYENYHVRQGLTLASLKWAFNGVHSSNWHPLTTLSHILDWTLFGPWAGGHHLTNMLLHAASSVVLFLALRRLTGAIWLSGLVAALFCLHPLHVESVAWISERKDVLSGLFFGLTLWAYAAYAEYRAGSREQGARSTEQAARRRFPWGRYLLVVALFALGLLCKPMLVTLPFVLLLLDFWPLARWTSAWPPAPLILEKLPLMLLSLASCVVTYFVQSSSGAVAETASALVRVQTVALGYARYLGMLVWPFQLATPYPRDREIYPAATLIIGLALVAFSALALIYGRRQRGYLLVGWFWFLGMLIPVSGLVIIGDQSVADRYSYLTFTGIFIALVWGAADFLGARKDCSKTGSLAASEEALISGVASSSTTACHGAANSRAARFAYTNGKSSIAETCGWTIAGVVVVFCAVRSFQQARIWRSSDVLYQHTLAVTTNNAIAHTNYGVILSSQGKFADAERHLREALRIKPRDKLAYNDLGLLEFERKNYPAAKAYLKTALEIEPTSGLVRSNLAGVYCESGDAKAAEQLCLEAIAIDPTLSKAESNLGTALASQGRYGDAIPHYQRALELDSDNLGCRVNMAISLFAQGSADQAIVELETALQLDPESVRCHHELAKIYNSLRRLSEAESQWKIVLSLDPAHAAAAKGLGMVLVKTGRGSDAIGALQVALAAEPRDLETRRYLAFAFMAAKQLKAGIEGFREILREDPKNAIAMNTLAWIEATHPDAALRNGKEAVELAEKAAGSNKAPLPNALDTLAAAYAEAGRFKEAVETAKKAKQAAEKAKDQALVDGIAARLKLYEAGKPYRDQTLSK